MKILFEIKTTQTPSVNDIIYWNGKEWTTISKDLFLASSNRKIESLAKRLTEAEARLDKKDEQINTLAKVIGGK